MSKHRLLLCFTAILCVSGRSALLIIGALSLTYLLTLLLGWLLNTLRLPYPPLTATLFSVAAGNGLSLLLLAFIPQSGKDLVSLLPLSIVWFLCALAVQETPPSFGKWIGGSGVLVVTGCVREMLSTASLFTYPLTFSPAGEVFGRHATGKIGVGGLLIAAGLLWLFGQGRPLQKGRPFHGETAIRLGLVTTMVAAADGVCRWSLPDLSDFWRFWITLALTIVPFIWDEPSIPPIAAVIPAVAVNLISGDMLWQWLAMGIGTGAMVWIFSAAWDRLFRSPLSPRFAGAPCALTATAIFLSAIRAIS